MIIAFFSAPLFKRWLGLELYGVFTTGQNFFLFVSLIDVGFNVGAQKLMTEAFHDEAPDRAWLIHRVQLALGLGVASVGLLLYLGIGLFQRNALLSPAESVQFFLSMGLNFGALWGCLYFSSVLAAQAKFQHVSLMYFLVTLCASMGALGMAWKFRTVVPLAAGYGVGSVVGLALFILILKRLYPLFRLRPAFDKPIAKDIFRLGATSYYPYRVATTFSNRSDRQIIAYSVSYALSGAYALMCRPAEIGKDLLTSMVETMQPEVTRDAHVSLEKASQTLHRNCLIVWMIGCAALIVPCAMGESILHQWIREDVGANQGLVLWLMAINYGAELHYVSLSTINTTRGTLARVSPFPAVNAVLTLACTLFFVRRYGLLGVGIMNAAFSIIQLYPRIYVMKWETDGHFPIARHFWLSAGIFAVACFYSWLGWSASFAFHKSLLSLALVPVLGAATLATCIGLRLSPAPRFFARIPLLRRLVSSG